MLTCVVLPVNDLEEIESTANLLRQARRNGIELIPEVADWLDWAEQEIAVAEGSAITLWKEDIL